MKSCHCRRHDHHVQPAARRFHRCFELKVAVNLLFALSRPCQVPQPQKSSFFQLKYVARLLDVSLTCGGCLVRGVKTIKLPAWHPAPPRKRSIPRTSPPRSARQYIIQHTLALPFLHHHKEEHAPPQTALGGFIRFVESCISWAVYRPHPPCLV